MTNFLSEIKKTTAQARKVIDTERADGGIAKLKMRIRKFAARGKTKIYINLSLPNTKKSAEVNIKHLKAEGMKIQRTESGVWAYWV
tara:strand:+ start:221 stop:478 length:258 start_codon:yes stop_codon:yes gene_type:complete